MPKHLLHFGSKRQRLRGDILPILIFCSIAFQRHFKQSSKCPPPPHITAYTQYPKPKWVGVRDQCRNLVGIMTGILKPPAVKRAHQIINFSFTNWTNWTNWYRLRNKTSGIIYSRTASPKLHWLVQNTSCVESVTFIPPFSFKPCVEKHGRYGRSFTFRR
jgi:hypothetical protein